MNFDFERILFYATLITGVVALFDIIFLARHRKDKHTGKEKKLPVIIDYARSFFPILLIVFLLRSFLFEPFRIPSGSLEPTLLMGDFILVNKFRYGLRWPIIHKRLLGDSEPKRGDIIVFRWPPNPSYNFIKRVIGLPGDHISYINKELFINGQPASQMFLKNSMAEEENGHFWEAKEMKENLLGLNHNIFINPEKQSYDFENVIVPEGMYFVMGDNRDDSADSRYWGFVPDKNIVGKATMIWMSWNGLKDSIRWNRLGKVIH